MKDNSKIKCRVKVNPKLEPVVQNLTPSQLRRMARELRRDAHQVEFKAMIMEIDAMPKPPKKLRWLPPEKLKRN